MFLYSSCPASISFVTICGTNHSFCCFSNKLLLFFVVTLVFVDFFENCPLIVFCCCCCLFVLTECEAVGVADNKTIPDDRMNASSFYDSAVFPYYGRLNASRGGGAWCPKTPTDRSDFLEVDMGAVRSVCGVATQGQASSHRDWTKSFKLSLSENGINWTTYKDNGNETVSTWV